MHTLAARHKIEYIYKHIYRQNTHLIYNRWTYNFTYISKAMYIVKNIQAIIKGLTTLWELRNIEKDI